MGSPQQHASFQSWALNRLRALNTPSATAAKDLGWSGGLPSFFKQDPIPTSCWPLLAQVLAIRFDEMLQVMNYYDPIPVADYRALIRNTFRYLVARASGGPATGTFSSELSRIALDEMLVQVETDFPRAQDRRVNNRRRSEAPVREGDQRIYPRRLADLLRYLRAEAAVNED